MQSPSAIVLHGISVRKQDIIKDRGATQNDILPCPLPRSCLVPSTIGLIQVRNVGYKRIIGVRVR